MSVTFEEALDDHDRAIAARGIAIWIGSEPTFTDASSFDAEWNGAAIGPTKEARARSLLARVARERPHAIVLRSVGRQYGGESAPRWAYWLWERRDGARVWDGPRDPLLLGEGVALASEAEAKAQCAAARDAIAATLSREGWGVATFETEGDLRIAARVDGTMPDPEDGRLLDPSPHATKTPEAGLADPLATEDRTWLVRMRAEEVAQGFCVRIELPDLIDVAAASDALALIARALEPLALPALVLAGHPLPSDETIAHASVTPDPAVIEINTAPSPGARAFHEDARVWHAIAREEGLAPRRLFYDGEIADSGGGGQLTIGGPSADASPFFVAPLLLPRLVAFLQRHPSLSYLFAVDNVGPWSQSPRADEGLRASFRELQLAMRTLSRAKDVDRALVHATLSPFLCDATGNAHRAEINVEKLWNEDLPRRGKLGLVELRAFRMARSPERAAALAALVRAIVAHLASTETPIDLTELGDDLHDGWLLPSFLERDLDEVLAELRAGGLGLGAPIESELRDHGDRTIGIADLDGAKLTIRRAIEIWPLVGDAGSQEHRAARFIDASTRRIEIVVEGTLDRVRVAIDGVLLPLTRTSAARAIAGLRFRAFVPARGLHPSVPPHVPPRLIVWREGEARAHALTLHDWRPDGGAYDGLPRTDAEARARRAERFVITETTPPPDPRDPPPATLTLDRRSW